MLVASSSLRTTYLSSATGASLTAFTVTVKLCDVDKSPSLTTTIKDSLPLKFSDALNVTLLPSKTAII